jgi:hypothetical protein
LPDKQIGVPGGLNKNNCLQFPDKAKAGNPWIIRFVFLKFNLIKQA